MTSAITIAIDLMGGDSGIDILLRGIAMSLEEHPETDFLLFGDSKKIEPLLEKYKTLAGHCEIVHADVEITMDEKPAQALRKGRKVSSMWMALDAVKQGRADATISSGNTGALMAMATICLRPIEGISRPAIACIWPTLRNESIVLDVGATVGADAKQLVDFAILGAALGRALFDMRKPTLGLLNVGVEDAKGLEPVKEAGRTLQEFDGAGYRYHGFVEGDDIGKGTVDVVVTEGFTGNIALKTAEGTARQIGNLFRQALNDSLMSKIGALFAQGALRALRDKMDPSNSNGGVFLGLNGVVIKSHGSADARGFKSALNLAHDMAQNRLIERVTNGIKRFNVEIAPEDISSPDATKTSQKSK